MDNQVLNLSKITARLKAFGYRYEATETYLKVYLPMFCYLKIKPGPDKISITSHLSTGFRFLPIEINFLIYGLILYTLTWFQWDNFNKGIFALLGIILLHFIVCFIKLESLRSILHNWIDNDRLA